MKNITLIVLSTFILSGCAIFEKTPPVEKVIYKTAPLYAPARPVLPTWTGSDMECLSEDVKEKIRERDTLRKNYAEQLEVIINSTH